MLLTDGRWLCRRARKAADAVGLNLGLGTPLQPHRLQRVDPQYPMPCSSPKSSMLLLVASKMRRPKSPSMATSAKSLSLVESRAAVRSAAHPPLLDKDCCGPAQIRVEIGQRHHHDGSEGGVGASSAEGM